MTMGVFDHVMLVAWGVEFVYNTTTGKKGCHIVPGYLKRSLARIQRWHTSFTGQSFRGLKNFPLNGGFKLNGGLRRVWNPH